MSIEIWKFPLRVVPHQAINAPKAKFLHVAVQCGQPCIWAEVIPETEAEITDIFIYGTGQPLLEQDRGNYLGTFMMGDGRLVWHVYVLTR